MLLTTAQITSLKQNNISVDGELTKQRTAQVWKSAKNAMKNDIVALAGCAKATVYRVFQTGSISIKLALAIGQTLNINPYYLTGEADEPGEFSEALLLQLLEQHGYTKLLAEIAPPPVEEKPKRKYTHKPKPVAEESANAPEPEDEVAEEAAPEPEPQPEPATVAVEEATPQAAAEIVMSEEDMQAVLHALFILSKAGIADATDKLAKVKGILIS